MPPARLAPPGMCAILSSRATGQSRVLVLRGPSSRFILSAMTSTLSLGSPWPGLFGLVSNRYAYVQCRTADARQSWGRSVQFMPIPSQHRLHSIEPHEQAKYYQDHEAQNVLPRQLQCLVCAWQKRINPGEFSSKALCRGGPDACHRLGSSSLILQYIIGLIPRDMQWRPVCLTLPSVRIVSR